MKIYLSQLVFDKTQFEHFLLGDGEYYYNEDTGDLETKASVEDWLFNECDCKSMKEAKEILEEQHIYKSYNDLCALYEYYDDYGWAIDYIEVGDKVVMSLAQNG